MTWNGSEWAPADAGGAANQVKESGLTTTGLSSGDIGYISGDNTLSKTDASTASSSEVYGVNAGTAGEMVVSGIVDVNCTTENGSPNPGDPVWLAPASLDSGTAAGKATSACPDTAGQFAVELGVCQDDSNYAGSKTCKINLNPKAPIGL
jgi:hypothetical protein